MKQEVCYIRNQEVLKRIVAGQFLLVPLKKLKKNRLTEKLFILNVTSSFIWDFLSKKRSFRQIRSAILREFVNTDQETVKKDVKSILREFLKRNLVIKT